MDHQPCLFYSVTLGVLAPLAAALLEYFQPHFKLRLKLLKLPELALHEVLKTMDHRDVFMLSLCSKNAFKKLRKLKTKVNWLCLIDKQNVIWVYSRQSWDTRDLLLWARIVSNFNNGPKNKLKIVRLTVGEMDVQCIWGIDGINFIDTTVEAIQRALNNHIHQLFTAKYIDLEVSAENISKKNYRNLSGVTDLCLHEAPRNRQDLKEILEKYPDLKSIRIDRQNSGPLSFDSRIFDIENVFINHLNQSGPFFWDNFKGRFAALGKGEFHEWDVIHFVRSWILGRKCCNLELIFVTKAGGKLDAEMILRMLRPSSKEWNRPPVYEIQSRLIGSARLRKETITFDTWENFIGFMDFERETDQKMATLILFRYGGFGFLVWN